MVTGGFGLKNKILNISEEDYSSVDILKEKLASLAEEVIYYDDLNPVSSEEIIKRASDADAIMVSLRTNIGAFEIETCSVWFGLFGTRWDTFQLISLY